MNNFCKYCGKKLDDKECDCNKINDEKNKTVEKFVLEKEDKNIKEVNNVTPTKRKEEKDNVVSSPKKSGNGIVILVFILIAILAVCGDAFIFNFIDESVFDYSVFEDDTINHDEIIDDFLYDSNYEDNVKDNDEDNVEDNVENNVENNGQDKNQDTVIEDEKIQYYESSFYDFNTYQYNLLNIDGSNLNLNFITDSTGDTIDIYGTLDNYSDSEYDLNLIIKYYDYAYNEIGTCNTSVYVNGDSHMNGKGFLCSISPNDLRVSKTVYDIVYYKVFVDNSNSVK